LRRKIAEITTAGPSIFVWHFSAGIWGLFLCAIPIFLRWNFRLYGGALFSVSGLGFVLMVITVASGGPDWASIMTAFGTVAAAGAAVGYRVVV
jgi:hypothetical protein